MPSYNTLGNTQWSSAIRCLIGYTVTSDRPSEYYIKPTTGYVTATRSTVNNAKYLMFNGTNHNTL